MEGREFTEWSGQPPLREEAEEVPNAWDIEAIAESLKAEPIDEVYTPWPNLTEAVLFDVGNDQKTHLTLAPHRASEFKRIRAYVHVEDVSLKFEPTGPPVTGKQEVMFLSDTESRRAVGEESEQSGSSPVSTQQSSSSGSAPISARCLNMIPRLPRSIRDICTCSTTS